MDLPLRFSTISVSLPLFASYCEYHISRINKQWTITCEHYLLSTFFPFLGLAGSWCVVYKENTTGVKDNASFDAEIMSNSTTTR